MPLSESERQAALGLQGLLVDAGEALKSAGGFLIDKGLQNLKDNLTFVIGNNSDTDNQTARPRNADGTFAKGGGGESAEAARGREAHDNYKNAVGSSYEYNKALPSGKRPDAINKELREVRELKPDNPKAVAAGRRQLEGYRQELERITGEKWTSHVDTYKQ